MRLGNRQLVAGLLGSEVSEVTGVGVRGHQAYGHGLWISVYGVMVLF